MTPTDIRYALSKQIPAIERPGSYIHTNYGNIPLNQAAARLVAGMLRAYFMDRLAALEKGGGK